MNISDMPPDLESFERFNRDYEETHFQYAESNARIGAATRDLLLGFYFQRFLWALGRPLVYSMMDDPLRKSFGFPTSRCPFSRQDQGDQ